MPKRRHCHPPGKTHWPAAALRHRLRLQAMRETDDDAGGRAVTWVDVTALWAAIEDITGDDGLWADAPAGHRRSRVVTRYREDLAPGMRFLTVDGRPLHIHAVLDPDGSGRRLVCLCGERPL